jgi:hypothetical protein
VDTHIIILDSNPDRAIKQLDDLEELGLALIQELYEVPMEVISLNPVLTSPTNIALALFSLLFLSFLQMVLHTAPQHWIHKTYSK